MKPLFGLRVFKLFYLFTALLVLFIFSCKSQNQQMEMKENSEITEEDLDRLGITNKEFLSAASKRALAWPKMGNEWFGEFKVFDLKGDLAYEEGVVRRDPSAIIRYEGKYFVWYSKSYGPSQGFGGDVEKDKVFS